MLSAPTIPLPGKAAKRPLDVLSWFHAHAIDFGSTLVVAPRRVALSVVCGMVATVEDVTKHIYTAFAILRG